MGYKYSRYNVHIEDGNIRYIWNTFTDAFIELDEDAMRYMELGSPPSTDSAFFDPLYRNGCIIREEYDELGKILHDERAVMLEREPSVLQYTIAPGLGCNYDCSYCFEQNHRNGKFMSNDTQKSVLDYIVRTADNNPKLKQLRITWFGGEPLLYQDIIYLMSQRLIEYCSRRGIRYNAGIVTNGRFLDQNTAKKLAENGVRHAQISFDGMPETYMEQKKATLDDFNHVVQNICECAEYLSVTVRINAGSDYSDALKLTDYLLKTKKLDGKIKIYVAHVRDYSCKQKYVEKESHQKYLLTQKDYMDRFGDGKAYQADSYSYIPPKRRFTTCATVCRDNFCIGPEGELYRCEHYFGMRDRIVGSVENGEYYNEPGMKYLRFAHLSKCENCEMFPICLGGCVNDVGNGEVALSCDQLKQFWIDQLLFHYRTRKGGK